MKVVSALKKFCEHCHFVKKGKKVYVKCIKNPRHKQRQGSGFCTIKMLPALNPKIDNSSLNSVNEINNLIMKLKIQNLIHNKY